MNGMLHILTGVAWGLSFSPKYLVGGSKYCDLITSATISIRIKVIEDMIIIATQQPIQTETEVVL